ncbi:MAG: GNAT family N-acetyltransferase [Cytophagales bacterium]|nr:GNAT family N-acetyltransferase [Cytophagales bacterium]
MSPALKDIRIYKSWSAIDRAAWNALLAKQSEPTPFMRWEYLNALQTSDSATLETGWDLRIVTLWDQHTFVAACPLYIKPHSYGEYVFDFAWANAYAQHGLDYYPKAVIAVPFTPVPGTRLLAQDDASKALLVLACKALAEEEYLSSLHLLFTSKADQAACLLSTIPPFMPRETTQFHWTNPTEKPYADFADFLKALSQDKRKKIKQERRKVLDAGVTFRHSQGTDIAPADWDFFYTCYERTYVEHGNAPYLSRAFFQSMASDMPENWLLFIAQIDGERIAASLIAIQHLHGQRVAYGRYWGALARVDCLHFEACYYQPLAWCIANGYQRFEGGAQGEHKMARALLPVTSTSLHHIAHPPFAKAIERFLARERAGVADYHLALTERSPLKHL